MPKPWTTKQSAVIAAAESIVFDGPLPKWGADSRPIVLIAFICASWWETRLGEYDGGDDGRAWGPWQTSLDGVGRGHAVADLQRPLYSGQLMWEEMEAQDARTGLLTAAYLQGSARDFVAAWNAEVERPGAHEGVRMHRLDVGKARGQLVDDWWGGPAASLPARGWSPRIVPASRP